MYLFKCAVRKFKTPCRAPIGSASPGRVSQHWAGGPGGASSAIAGALPSEGGPAPCPAHVACTHAHTSHGARFSSPCQYDLFWDSLPLKRKEKQSWNAASSVSRLPLTSSGSHLSVSLQRAGVSRRQGLCSPPLRSRHMCTAFIHI